MKRRKGIMSSSGTQLVPSLAARVLHTCTCILGSSGHFADDPKLVTNND
jgi:hypothetical protein